MTMRFMSSEKNHVGQAPTFKVSNPKRLNKGHLVGSVDVSAPWGIKIIGVMLFQKDGKRWLSFPSKEWIKQDGSKGYLPLVEWIGQDAREEFERTVLPLAERALLTPPLADADDGIPF
jgi:hypothetical protein